MKLNGFPKNLDMAVGLAEVHMVTVTVPFKKDDSTIITERTSQPSLPIKIMSPKSQKAMERENQERMKVLKVRVMERRVGVTIKRLRVPNLSEHAAYAQKIISTPTPALSSNKL